MNDNPLPSGKYRHYKGNVYQVTAVATHTETGEKLVVYQALYGENGIWTRPLDMFMETVNHEGRVLPRFERISD